MVGEDKVISVRGSEIREEGMSRRGREDGVSVRGEGRMGVA